MSSGFAIWLVIVVAIVAANLPFVSQRIFFFGPLRHPKHLGWRLAEWVLLCALSVVAGFSVEAKLGQIQPQGWEFYAAFAFLFATLAFPGFVWRCLRRDGQAAPPITGPRRSVDTAGPTDLGAESSSDSGSRA